MDPVQGVVSSIDEAGRTGTIANDAAAFTFTRDDVQSGVVFNQHLAGVVVNFVADGRTARNVSLPPFDRAARARQFIGQRRVTRY